MKGHPTTNRKTTIFRLHDEQTVNGLWKIAWVSVFRFRFLSSSMFSCPQPCPRPCFWVLVHVAMSSSMFPCQFSCSCQPTANGKQNWRKTATAVCLLQMVYINGISKLPVVCCKRKRPFFFLGQQTMKDNWQLLRHQTCTSTSIRYIQQLYSMRSKYILFFLKYVTLQPNI